MNARRLFFPWEVSGRRHSLLFAVGLLTGVPAPAAAQAAPAASTLPQRDTHMETPAKGTFEVTLTPQPAEGTALGRMVIDKRFHGDLEAVSQGQMLSAMGTVQGSAGYVAMEVVRGTLQGRRGSFVLQHTGTMNRGAPELSVTVVPDSGTDELAGLTGRMRIIIEGGRHSYEFEYRLAEAGR